MISFIRFQRVSKLVLILENAIAKVWAMMFSGFPSQHAYLVPRPWPWCGVDPLRTIMFRNAHAIILFLDAHTNDRIVRTFVVFLWYTSQLIIGMSSPKGLWVRIHLIKGWLLTHKRPWPSAIVQNSTRPHFATRAWSICGHIWYDTHL